ncbi:MAG TPA: EAL domain-containing protein [Mycobacteriales bacterium]|nr:EAL domain-containing protein [Mycobacteriales bacterium]
MTPTSWRRFLIPGLLGVGVIAAAPADLQPILTLLLSVGSLVAMRRGTRAWAGANGRPWNLLRHGAWLFVVAQLVRAGHAAATGVPKPFPSPADPVYYVGYALLIAGVVTLVRRRKAQVEGDNLLDALILVTCLGVVVTAYVLQPYVESIYLTPLQKALSVMYTLCDLVLVGVTVRLAVGGGRRSKSYYLLGGAWSMALLADALVTVETSGAVLAPWTYLTSAVSYVLLATAALHPSMAALAERPPPEEVRLTRVRLATLFVAMILVPAMLAWEMARGGGRAGTYAVGSIVMALLVLARLAGLVRSKERKAERETVLRAAAATFAGTLDAGAMRDVAVATVARIAAGDGTARASLATVADGDLRVVASIGPGADRALGSVVDLAGSPEPAAAVASGRWRAARMPAIDVAEPDPKPRHVLVVPLVARRSIRGAFVVTTDRVVPFEVVAAIGSLADQLSVALEANALADEIARRRHERRFRALVEHGSDLVALVDRSGTVFFASPACEHLLGVPDSDLVGRHPFERIHPDDRGLANSLLDVVWASAGSREPIESRFRHADGSWRWFEVVAENLLDEEVGGVVVHFRDIADRKRAQLELQENANRFQSLVQHASDVVVVLDQQARIAYVSPSVTRVLGYLPDEIAGTSGTVLVHGDDLATLPHDWHDAFPPFTREIRVRRRNGDWAVVEFTASDLRREAGVAGIVLNGRDVTDRKRLESELRRLALHDGLTGLANRTLFLDRVTQALARDRDAASNVSVLFVDLDDFKTVNDGLGHVAGDALLRAVAGRLRGCVRGQDTAARLGGDEFGVLLDGVTDAEAAEVAQRIGASFAGAFVIDGRQLHVTATIGVVVRHDDGASTEMLLRRADVAMYLAKTRGKNRVQFYEPGMEELFRERLELRGDLAAALAEEQFHVVYQPIVSLATGDLEGFEALVRWQHPERGLVPPNVFVPIAEETGDIVALGQWVLGTACRQLAAWQRAYDVRPRMSVNLSIRQLEYPGLLGQVRAAIADAGVAAGDLTLEITESVLAADVDVVRGQLEALQELGVRIAIDDFGTGYSSFGYLSQFPVDVLKIDRTFVRDLTAVESEEADIVRAIVSLARSRGLRTVAEGIEETAQADVLRELGCDTGQGYLYARPLAPEDLAATLAEAAVRAALPAQRTPLRQVVRGAVA